MGVDDKFYTFQKWDISRLKCRGKIGERKSLFGIRIGKNFWYRNYIILFSQG